MKSDSIGIESDAIGMKSDSIGIESDAIGIESDSIGMKSDSFILMNEKNNFVVVASHPLLLFTSRNPTNYY